MYEIKFLLIVTALLLAATGFCIYQVNTEKKAGHYSEIKSESPWDGTWRSIVWTVVNATI